MLRPVLILTLAAGCLGGGAEEPPPDLEAGCLEPVAIDPAGVLTTWAVDSVDLPSSTSSEANALGLNIDCDPEGRPDNALGNVLSIVYVHESSDLDAEVNALVADGRLLHLLDVRATSTVNARGAGLTVLHGLDLDGDPADNFSGVEVFGIDEGRGRGTLSGHVMAGRLDARGGQVPLGLGLPTLDEIVILPLEAARVDVTFTGDGRLEGRIGGGIPQEAIDAILIPFIHRALSRAVERDCPDGVCRGGSFGEALLGLFDDDGDGVMTVDELRQDDLIGALLRPDLDLFDEDGELNPRADGVTDSMSIGIRFTAVPAAVR